MGFFLITSIWSSSRQGKPRSFRQSQSLIEFGVQAGSKSDAFTTYDAAGLDFKQQQQEARRIT